MYSEKRKSPIVCLLQVTLSEDYLECVAKQQETLRPFGDIPRDVKGKVSRSFVTARSFVQGLLVSADVVRKVSQVSVLLLVSVLWDINLNLRLTFEDKHCLLKPSLLRPRLNMQ